MLMLWELYRYFWWRVNFRVIVYNYELFIWYENFIEDKSIFNKLVCEVVSFVVILRVVYGCVYLLFLIRVIIGESLNWC